MFIGVNSCANLGPTNVVKDVAQGWLRQDDIKGKKMARSIKIKLFMVFAKCCGLLVVVFLNILCLLFSSSKTFITKKLSTY